MNNEIYEIDKEKIIIDKVINKTIQKKKKYLKIIHKNNPNLLIKSIYFNNFIQFNSITQNFLHKSSTMFFPFVKKIVQLLQYPIADKLSFIMQKIVDEVLISGSRIENDDLKIYFKKILRK